eukprot:10963513-Prorocentrum_lima.AAC.1
MAGHSGRVFTSNSEGLAICRSASVTSALLSRALNCSSREAESPTRPATAKDTASCTSTLSAWAFIAMTVCSPAPRFHSCCDRVSE